MQVFSQSHICNAEFFSVSDAKIYSSVIFDDWAVIVDGALFKGKIP